jgi:hypothetical protein
VSVSQIHCTCTHTYTRTQAVAGIFSGRITAWNNTEIQSTNFPDRDQNINNDAILRVVRSDASGTTESFVKALYSFTVPASTSTSAPSESPTAPDKKRDDPAMDRFFLQAEKGSSLPDWPRTPIRPSDGAVCKVRNCSNVKCGKGFFFAESFGVCEMCPEMSYMAEDAHQNLQCAACERHKFSTVSVRVLLLVAPVRVCHHPCVRISSPVRKCVRVCISLKRALLTDT